MKDRYFGEIVYGRRSTRLFEDCEVEDGVLRRMVGIAALAPSAHNSQPSRFLILRRGHARGKMVASMLEKYRTDLVSDNLAPERINERMRRSESLLLRPPVVILVCLTMRDMWHYPDEPRKAAEYLMAVQSTAAAIQNLLLAAHAEGLGACWLCAPLFAKAIVKLQLGLPEDYDPQAFVIVGHPAETPLMPPRKPVDDIMQVL